MEAALNAELAVNHRNINASVMHSSQKFLGENKYYAHLLNPRRWGLQPNMRRWDVVCVNITPPLLTEKPRAVEIHGRRQSKARNEKVQVSASMTLLFAIPVNRGEN